MPPLANPSGEYQRAALTPLVLLLLAIALVGVGYGAWSDSRSAMAQAERRVADMAGLLALRATDDFSAAHETLDRVQFAVMEQGRGKALSGPALRESLDAIFRSQSLGRVLWVVDAEGRGVASTVPIDGRPFYSDRQYFRRARDGAAFSVSTIVGRSTGQTHVVASRRLEDFGGRFLGVASLALDPLRFNLDLGPTGLVALMQDDGSVLARNPAADPAVDRLPLDPGLTEGPFGVVVDRSPVDGVERLWAFQRLPKLPLVAVAGISLSEVRQEWIGHQVQMALWTVPLLILALLLSWRIAASRRREHDGHRQLVAALAERDILLAEVHHRVKNNLQIVQSLLMMESLGAEPKARKGYDESLQRIQAMGAVHELLYRTGQFGTVPCVEYVRQLAGLLAGSYAQVRLTIDGDAVALDLDRAMPFAMAANEIISNALKHAFSECRAGLLAISVRHRGGMLTLSVADDGPGLPEGFDPAKSASLGTRLLLRLAKQLGGSVAFESVGGTLVRLSFPLDGPPHP